MDDELKSKLRELYRLDVPEGLADELAARAIRAPADRGGFWRDFVASCRAPALFITAATFAVVVSLILTPAQQRDGDEQASWDIDVELSVQRVLGFPNPSARGVADHDVP